jgi:exopolysaccharide biosynthesis protein
MLGAVGAASGQTADGRATASASRHVSYARRSVLGTEVHILTVNLNEPSVRLGLSLAEGLPSGDEPFTDLVRKHGRPVAAINGTFFDKQTLRPMGDLVIGGQVFHHGRQGTVLAFTKDRRASIRRVPFGRTQDYSQHQVVLGCGPTLLLDGEIDLQAAEERFRDPHVLGTANRSAAGLTPSGKLLLVSVPRGVTLTGLAKLMLQLGCDQAMNLDGGASMAMYYRGKVVLPAGRRLTNILTVYEDQHQAL